MTNYVEYSLQGYEVQAFRYLLKAEMPQKLERYVQQALTAYRKTRDTVRIFCDGEDVELQPQQILYAEMSARKVCLHLQGADRALLYTTATMADLADLLENHGFVRTHKSVLVNMEHIRNLQSTRLYLRDGTELPVSSHTASAVRKSIRSGGARKNGLLVRDRFQLLGRAVRGRFCDAFLERKTRGLRFVVGALLCGVLSYIATIFVSHISEESPITLLKFAALITVYFVLHHCFI